MKPKTLNLLFSALLLLICQSALSQPWANATVEKRAKTLLAQMTLEEKLAYVGGENKFFIRAIPRIGLPAIRMSDGPQGLNNDGKANALPCGILLASTWNKSLANTYGTALGQDAKARGVSILLGPGVNIYRAPMCGRNFEYFGEDPYLTSKTAVNYINGVQSEGVMATIKHFAANNQEWNRYFVSSDVDVRTMQEIYLPAFYAAIKEANVGAVMSSYNLLNGIYTTHNGWLLKDVLRKQWDFKGILMSDWEATHNSIAAANGGLDIEMPSGKYMSVDSLNYFIKNKELTVSTIDEKVLNILRTIVGFGFLDKKLVDKSIPLNNPYSDEVALKVAREGIVLLKNDNKTLPLNSKKIKKIAICGPNMITFPTAGGSGWLDPFHYVSAFDGIKKIAAENNIQVVYLDGYSKPKNALYIEKNALVQGLKAQYFDNRELQGKPVLERIDSTVLFNWDNGTGIEGMPKINYSVRWTGVYRPIATKRYNLFIGGDDGFRLMIDGKVIAENWEYWKVTAKNVRLELEANRDYEICIEFYQGEGGANVKFESTIVENELLTKSIADADVIVAGVGFDKATEAEGNDRTFELSIADSEMLKVLASTGKPVIAVGNAGGAVEMQGWYPKLSALLWAWYPGQQGGTALAEILFGKVNPSGKLPITFEKKWADNPTFNSYFDDNNDKRVTYKEGIFVGYRGYDKNKTEVQFPFGYGLSYTTFELSDLKVEKSANKTSKARVTCKIKNTGTLEGAEVVQLYIGGKPTANQPQPVKELKGYEKISLKAGESKTVNFEVSERDLSYFSTAKNKFIFDAGEYKFMIGTSSRDIKLEQKMAVK